MEVYPSMYSAYSTCMREYVYLERPPHCLKLKMVTDDWLQSSAITVKCTVPNKRVEQYVLVIQGNSHIVLIPNVV